MGFIQENNIEINIGLKHEYRLIHFSDVHSVTYNDSDSDEVINEAKRCEEVWLTQKVDFAKGANEKCNESHMIPSKKCLENLVDYVNEQKPNAVVMTGDILDYYSPSNYDLLLEACGNMNYPFIFTNGNHDSIADRFEDITNSKIGFSVLEFNDFKIVGLDDSTKKVSKDTLLSLKEELKDKKPIIIAMHIPLCTSLNRESLNRYDPYFLIDEDNCDGITKEFIDLLKDNDLIKAILAGHVHGHSESYFANNKKQYLASSGLIGLVNKIIVK